MCFVCTRVGADGKDDARRLNEQLVSELNTAHDDMKRLRQAIDQMAREYEAAKELDVFRRYGMLKRAVKRTIMHLRLHQNNCDDQGSAVVVFTSASKTRTKDELRKRTNHINGMSSLKPGFHSNAIACVSRITQQTQAPANRFQQRSKQWQPWLAACQRKRLRLNGNRAWVVVPPLLSQGLVVSSHSSLATIT